MKNGLPVLGIDVLSVMQTKVLLGRLRRLQRCEESASGSDATPAELARTEGILFKDTPEWKTAHAELTQVLATREHIPHGVEARTARHDRARASRTAERHRR